MTHPGRLMRFSQLSGKADVLAACSRSRDRRGALEALSGAQTAARSICVVVRWRWQWRSRLLGGLTTR
jgi:hypothetical protein